MLPAKPSYGHEHQTCRGREPVSESDLIRWLEHLSVSNYRRAVLKPMHKDRLIEYNEAKRVIRLLPPGVMAAETLVATKGKV